MDGIKPLGWIKADTDILEHAVKAESRNTQPEAEEQGGIIIIPPLMDDTERNAYPDDYIAYCRERERKRAIIQGETLEAPDFPPEMMKQAEEASRAFNAQAEEATKAMEEYIERGERRQ
ncbi:hypothetical protein GX865_06815 [Candidatus Saccharibacteria bacterium]|jgi:hypothetical protein|nr:hypothetical protein [Candidatus Saccharibacteria bacterium]